MVLPFWHSDTRPVQLFFVSDSPILSQVASVKKLSSLKAAESPEGWGQSNLHVYEPERCWTAYSHVRSNISALHLNSHRQC